MLDIETLSTNSNAVVLTISAVQFNKADGELGEEFEIALNINQQTAKGAIIDGDTVMWWLAQSHEAQAQLLELKPTGVGHALDQFNEWLEGLFPTWDDQKEVGLWGNGSNFDCTIVRNLYGRQGKKFILPYWCDKDVRTIVDYLGIDTRDYTFKGTKHNGLDDCKHQINYITGGLK